MLKDPICEGVSVAWHITLIDSPTTQPADFTSIHLASTATNVGTTPPTFL